MNLAVNINVAFGAGSVEDRGNLPTKFLANPEQWARDIVAEWGGKVRAIQLWNPFGSWVSDVNDAGETKWSMHFNATDHCRAREPAVFDAFPRALGLLRGAFERVDCYLGELSIHVNTNPMRVWVNNQDPTLVTAIPQGNGWHGEPSPHVREGDPQLYREWFERQVQPVIGSGCGVFTGTSRGLPLASNRYQALNELQSIGVRVGIEPIPRPEFGQMADLETWSRQRFVERQESKGWDRLPLASLTARRCIGMLDSPPETLLGDVNDRLDAGWQVALRPAALRQVLA